jgi:hypothetical protein
MKKLIQVFQKRKLKIIITAASQHIRRKQRFAPATEDDRNFLEFFRVDTNQDDRNKKNI